LIEREERDGIVTLRLAHGKASAMDVELMEAFGNALDAAHDARAIVLTGTGSIFSAGVDLFRLTNEGPEYVQRFFPLLRDGIRKLFTMPVPVVAACGGHAIAGGCILVEACDYRLMAEGNGRIGVPELLVGVPFPTAALEVVKFGAPAAVAPLVLTGRTLLPREALAFGLLDEVVDAASLQERAFAMATQLATIPRQSFRLTKAALRAEAVERMSSDRAVSNDEQALAVWSDPAVHAAIRDYLARTVRK
jgi:enoyl-CoA hydratase